MSPEVSDLLKFRLQRVRQMVQDENYADVLRELRMLRKIAESDYGAALKLSKFTKKLSDSQSVLSNGLKKVRIAIISSSTTSFLEPILKYFFAVDGMDAEVRCGDFGNWRQDILNPDSWLVDFNPDILFVSLNYRDANLPMFSVAPESEIKKLADDIEDLWNVLRRNLPQCIVFQHDFDMPSFDSASLLSRKSGGRADMLLRLSSELRKRAVGFGVELVQFAKLQSLFGAEKWEDLRMWFHAKQHPNLEALPLVASEYARMAKAKFCSPKKVCVLDLDNTLWGGIIGEDGLGGIELGAPNARGEAFVFFQKYLKELSERGVILAVCSKNNPEDALAPFKKHDSMGLKCDDIASFKANWNSKSVNIANIARELNLGLDSFVFVDDNPAEIKEVSSALPQVECLLLPDDPADFVPFISQKNLFDTLTLSSDDLKRNRTYQQNAAREEAKASFENLDDFLKSLEMSCRVCNISDENIVRVVQLLGKTNQFNLTTRRESLNQIKSIISDSRNYARCFQLVDKYGDNGIVGIAIATPQDNARVLQIDTFVMSCRVIGRGLEAFMLNDIRSFAQNANVERVRGLYVPTKKNVQTRDLYAHFGFDKVSEDDEVASSVWEISTSKLKIQNCFIDS